MGMTISFDRYHTYMEVSDFLHACVLDYPGLCALESIGKSCEGRDIWMLERLTGAQGLPAANRLSMQTGTSMQVRLPDARRFFGQINHLLKNYGKDSKITYLLDTKAFYFVPRIAVDGSEYYLTTPYMLRSSLRQWPGAFDEKPGLYPEDVDGDGKVLYYEG